MSAAGQTYVRFALAERGAYSVMFRPERIDVTDATYQVQGFAAFDQLADLVAEAQRDGWRPDDDTTELSAVLWANVHGLAELSLHGALTAVVGPDGAERLPLLSTSLALDLAPGALAAPAAASPAPASAAGRPQQPGDPS